MANTSPNMTNLLADLMELGGYVGFDQAANALKHYREGTGTDLNMPESWLRSYKEIQQAERINQKIIQSKIVSNAANRARISDLREGESITLTGQYINEDIDPTDNTDLRFASGKSNLETEGVLTFTRRDEKLMVRGEFANRWYDRYDWEKGTQFFRGLVSGEEMQNLEHAKPFNMVGQWHEKVQGQIHIDAIGKPAALTLERVPSRFDPMADAATTFNNGINGAKYNSLAIELRREGAPTSLLDEIERGLTNQKWSKDERINPSLGAAIMHGIEGHDLLSNPLPGGFSALEKVASVRAQNVYERTGSAVEAARAAVDGVREAQKYSGPSQDVSPEDTLTPSQNRAQLAMNTKVLEARRASLLDGRAVRAGASAAPAAPAARAGAQKLYEQKAASLHPDPVAARRAVRTTLPEQFSLPDFSNLFNNAVDGLQNVLGVKAAAAKEVTATRGQLESAKVAGLVMDRPMADRVMTSKAYQTKTDPLNAFATKATQSFYGAAYADDNPSAPKRRSALEEPGRKAQVESLEQQQARETQARYDAAYADIDRENRQRDKDEAAQNKQREAAAAAEAKRVRDTAAMEDVGATPGALPTETVQVAKVDKLGDNAVSAAQAAQGGRQAGMLSTVNASQEARVNAASSEAEMKAVAARRANDSNERTQGASAQTMREESLYGASSTPGSLGTAGKRDASGKYISGTNSRGMSTGGVELDAQGREIGAYGQFTRDIVGRKNADGSSSSSNTRVICTELVRQGRMAPSLQRLDIAFTLRALSPATVRGYHFWAVPYVCLMRRSKLATALIEPIATWRALEIAHLLGERDRPHWRGKLVRVVMEPLCGFIGWVIEALPGDANRFHPGRVAGGRTKTPTL